MSTASASTSLSPPPPPSPGRSTSSLTATTPSTLAGGTHHRSRPSFAIAYSQPPPASASSSNPSGPTGPSSGSIASRPPFTSTSNLNSTTTPSAPSQLAAPQPSKHFVAPAHPQSHHLHTLPPREKTTRTLILDHTAWLHGRTRFAQGRCELRMKVKFKSGGQVAEASSAGNSGTGGRPGLYIGGRSGSASGLGGINAFGEPTEVELASSDEESEEGEAKENDGEDVIALCYGRGSRGGQREASDTKKGISTEDRAKDNRMEVDQEPMLNSDIDAEGELLARPSSPSSSPDPTLAPSLAARAIGIEKVLDAMLTQPPSSPPRSPSPPPYALHSAHAQSQHYRAPPPTQTMTSGNASIPPPSKPSRSLPNGVRLRLALLALVNDLFERQPPSPEEAPTSNPTSSVRPQANKPSTSTRGDPSNTSEPPKSDNAPSPPGSPPPLPPPSMPPPLPRGLASLAQVSSQPFYTSAALPSFHTLTLPSSSSGPSLGTAPVSNAPPSSANARGSKDAASSPTQTRRQPPPLYMWTRPSGGPTSPSSLLPPSPGSAAPFGSSFHSMDSASSPVSRQPSRPIPASWKDNTPKYQPTHRIAVGRARELYSTGCYASPGTSTYRGSPYTQTTSYRSNVTTYGSSAGAAPVAAVGYPVKTLKTLCPRHLKEKCVICVSGATLRGKPFTRIGAGLLKKDKGLLACAVRGDDVERISGSILADMIPRFLRLSALVAMELGREASGEEVEGLDGQEARSDEVSIASTSTVNPATRATLRAQPTRAWFALLCGLLTRAVLEGYVARGWKGPEYVEVLMGVGLGIKDVGIRRGLTGFSVTSSVIAQETRIVEEEDAGEFEPDEMPGLVEASRILFSGLVLDALVPGIKDKATQIAEEEYVAEMEERLSEFLTIPHSTPDLATHLIQLSAKYPAEPVERAALLFYEAVAKWRGKPELETYKRARPLHTSTSTPAPLPIDALLAPEPPRRPPIDRYFLIPPPSLRRPGTLKRQRSVTEEERPPPKKEKVKVEVEVGKEAMPDVDVGSEWTGPYGV